MNIYKVVSMLFTFVLFVVRAGRCLGCLRSLSAQFQLQVLPEEVWMLAGRLHIFTP